MIKLENYRVWNPQTKLMQYMEQNLKGDISFPTGSVFMRSTGLKDVNDLELYDADLVIVDDKYGPYMVWYDETLEAWCSCAYSDAEPISTYKTIFCVGNVLQNPDVIYEGQQYQP